MNFPELPEGLKWTLKRGRVRPEKIYLSLHLIDGYEWDFHPGDVNSKREHFYLTYLEKPKVKEYVIQKALELKESCFSSSTVIKPKAKLIND